MSDGRYNLIHGDCLEVMPTLDAGIVDMVLCDLPYGTTDCPWDAVIPFGLLWAEYRRLLVQNAAAVFTASQPFTTDLICSNRDWFKYEIIWRKSRPTDFVNAKNKPLKAHENICVFSAGATANCSNNRMPYFPQGLIFKPSRVFRPSPKMRTGSVVTERPSHVNEYSREYENYPGSVVEFANPNNDSVHPTQKPVALMSYLIQTYTRPGDTVLDNCMGSGTTGVACLNTGRKFIGIEKDAEHFATAQRRIEQVASQGRIDFEEAI